MVKYTSQTGSGVQHLSLLRKVIVRKMTGSLHFKLASKEPVSLDFFKGDLVGASAPQEGPRPIVAVLRKILAYSVVGYAWEECAQDAKYGWVKPAIGISSAITDLALIPHRADLYRKVFSKLPEVTLRPAPIHRHNFGDEIEYQYLYRLSLRSSSFRVTSFFSSTASEDVLLRQVRVILYAFLLGYLIPVGQKKAASSTKLGIAARIMKRFRKG